jgi:MFS family permease
VAAAPGLGFDRAWLPPLLANALAVMYFGGIVAYLPLMLRHVHGPNAGIFFTADAVGVLLLRIPTGVLADRYGSLLPKVIGVAATLPGIAVLALPASIPVLIVSGAFTGVGAGLFITGILADLARLSSDANRGTAMSLGTGSFSAAIFIGSAVSGLLIGAGFDAILIFGFATTAAALPFAWRRGSSP